MVTREPDLVSISVSVSVSDRVRVRVRARVRYVHARAGHEGLPEHVDALRLDADDLDRRVELLDSGGDPGEKRAAAHGEEDGVERRAPDEEAARAVQPRPKINEGLKIT